MSLPFLVNKGARGSFEVVLAGQWVFEVSLSLQVAFPRRARFTQLQGDGQIQFHFIPKLLFTTCKDMNKSRTKWLEGCIVFPISHVSLNERPESAKLPLAAASIWQK